MKNIKNLVSKISFSVVLISASFFITNTASVEPAEAYYGNWKSQHNQCFIAVTVYIKIAGNEQIISEHIQEGTIRRCVDGSGWCFWGGNCEGL